MNNRELYDTVEKMEEQAQLFVEQLALVKEATQEVVEKNTTLELENQKLRARLAELENQDSASSEKQSLSKSRMNLEKLYEDGFHVCNLSYGSRRQNDEECAFCLGVIYGDRNK